MNHDSPLTEQVHAETSKFRPQWFTWGVSLCIMVVVIVAAGSFLPQSAKKFVLYPAMIFMFAGIAVYELAQLCQVRWTKLQLIIGMCCALSGYLGQQYMSYQQYLVHQRKSLKPEFSNLMPALQDDTNASPEQQELKARMQQEFNPSITDYLRWKYSLLKWFSSTPAMFIFIGETLVTWGLVYFMMWSATLRQTSNKNPSVATGESGANP